MAQSSGSFSGSIRNGWQKLIVEWTSSQDAETNKSTITANMYFYSVGAIYIGTRNNTTTIDGASLPYTSPPISQSSGFTKLIGTVTREIQHDDNGNKTFSMSSIFNIDATLGGTYYANISASSGNIELPNIPRASTITVNDANIGSSTTININKKVSSFTTDLFWRVQGDDSWTSIGNTSQYSYGWQVPTSLYSRIKNAKTIKCEFKAVTKSGSTTIGEKTTTATFTATGNPVINSCTLVSTDTKTIDLVGNNRMIRYISTVQATVSASGTNSASISSIKVNGKTATNGVVSFPNADTYSYDVTVTDSRGYSTTRNFEITGTDYIPLTLNATVVRNQPTDGKVKITFNGNYYNNSFRKSDDTYVANYLGVQYRSRISGGTWGNWTSLTKNISGNTYSGTTTISGYDYTKQYEFQIWSGDQVKSLYVTGINVSKGKPTFNWGEDFFNVNGELRIFNQAILTNLYPVGSIYMSATLDTAQKVHNALGGTWVAWGSGRVPVGVNTSDSNFNTVEKTGGSPELQQHTHSARLNNNGNHKHEMHFGGTAGSGDGSIISIAKVYYGNDYGSMSEGEHDHGGITVDNAGSGDSGNLQPYITCYMWKRTA